MKIECPSCESESIDIYDNEGGAGDTYIEHIICQECREQWDEYYIHEEDLEYEEE